MYYARGAVVNKKMALHSINSYSYFSTNNSSHIQRNIWNSNSGVWPEINFLSVISYY
jgi:hypothetical protein